VLHDLYLDAIRNRESKISSISESDSNNSMILARAKELWTKYAPAAVECALAGVDSSYNKQDFQGFHLYALNALCINRESDVMAKEIYYDIGVTDQSRLETMSMKMENNVAGKAASAYDLVLVDGSMISRFVSANTASVKNTMDLIKEHENIAFISKTSDSREIFEGMGSKVGDIYYFNHVNREKAKAGYSKPFHVTRYKEPVTVVYARLGDYTPSIKLELPGKVGERESRDVIDKIAHGSLAGYPYVLKLAHERAIISDSDIARLVGILGVKNEFGARAVLH
jgi:NurA-like 5'-3' nuclease